MANILKLEKYKPPLNQELPNYVQDTLIPVLERNRIKTETALSYNQTGFVIGPVLSTDNAIPRWDGADGSHLQNSSVIISDTNSVSGVVDLSLSGILYVDHIAEKTAAHNIFLDDILQTHSKVFIGDSTDTGDFPDAGVLISGTSTGYAIGNSYTGLIVEPWDSTVGGDGIAGVGYVVGVPGATRYGVTGIGKVKQGGFDYGMAIGVAGLATDSHFAGGPSYNISFYANALNAATGNYAFYNARGDFLNVQDMIWYIKDNSATSFAFGSTGAASILGIDTLNGAEGVNVTGYLKVNGVDVVTGTNYWTRTGTDLHPATAGDTVTADGGLTIGTGGAGVDYALTFNGETNDGTITWMEDENYFTISPSILVDGTSNAIIKGNRTVAMTGATGGVMKMQLTSTGDMTDGFGPVFGFIIEDTAGVENPIGYVGAIRNGADDVGKITFQCGKSGGGTFTTLTNSETDTTIGGGKAGVDYTLTFNGETNDGVITWMEDEDYFKFSDDILMDSTEALYFRDTAIHIASLNDGHLDLTADTSIDLNAITLCGSDANTTDFPKAQFISSKDNSGITEGSRIGVVGEANDDAGDGGVGVFGIAKTTGLGNAFGVYGKVTVNNTSDAADIAAGYFTANVTHAGGSNYGIYSSASGGAANYSFYGNAGDIYNAGQAEVGGSGTTYGIKATASTYPGFFNRITSDTNTKGNSLFIKRTTDGNMADGFGPGLNFQIEDDGGSPNTIGNIYAIRDGADNTGKMSLWPVLAGTAYERLTVYASGIVDIPSQSGFSAYLTTTAVSCADSAYTTIVFDTEIYDTQAEHVLATGIFTATKAGKYVCAWNINSASVAWAVGEFWRASLVKNSSNTDGNQWNGHLDLAQAAYTGVKSSGNVAIVSLAVGDTLEIQVYQTQGGAVNTGVVGPDNYFTVTKIA